MASARLLQWVRYVALACIAVLVAVTFFAIDSNGVKAPLLTLMGSCAIIIWLFPVERNAPLEQHIGSIAGTIVVMWGSMFWLLDSMDHSQSDIRLMLMVAEMNLPEGNQVRLESFSNEIDARLRAVESDPSPWALSDIDLMVQIAKLNVPDIRSERLMEEIGTRLATTGSDLTYITPLYAITTLIPVAALSIWLFVNNILNAVTWIVIGIKGLSETTVSTISLGLRERKSEIRRGSIAASIVILLISTYAVAVGVLSDSTCSPPPDLRIPISGREIMRILALCWLP